MATTVEKSIRVEAPISAVYGQWTRFEDFPRFMGGVSTVEQLDDRRLHWVAEIAGVRREWDAEILQQIPDEKIAWAATEGATNAGQVTFRADGPTATEVTLHLEYEPEGLVEAVGDRLHIVEKQAESDLERFKTFLEAEGARPGGWRGTVNETMDVGDVGIDAAADTRGDSGKAGMSVKGIVASVAAAAVGLTAAAAAKSSQDADDQPVDAGEAEPSTSAAGTHVVPGEAAAPVPFLVTEGRDVQP